MTGTIKLYQTGIKGRPPVRKDTIIYSDVRERKAIIKRWVDFYGSAMNYHYVQIAPDVDLRKKIKP